jgi:hypothetical protein
MQPTCLYRYFDSEDRLLYIGITQNQGSRFQQHFATSAWFSKVHRATFQHFETREEALSAEQAAIVAELPIYNLVHNPRRETWRSHFDRLFDLTDNLCNQDEFHAELIGNFPKHKWPAKAEAKSEHRRTWVFMEAIWQVCGKEDEIEQIPCAICEKLYESPYVELWFNKAWESLDEWIAKGQPE